jgi:hypothetical protein
MVAPINFIKGSFFATHCREKVNTSPSGVFLSTDILRHVFPRTERALILIIDYIIDLTYLPIKASFAFANVICIDLFSCIENGHFHIYPLKVVLRTVCKVALIVQTVLAHVFIRYGLQGFSLFIPAVSVLLPITLFIDNFENIFSMISTSYHPVYDVLRLVDMFTKITGEIAFETTKNFMIFGELFTLFVCILVHMSHPTKPLIDDFENMKLIGKSCFNEIKRIIENENDLVEKKVERDAVALLKETLKDIDDRLVGFPLFNRLLV